MSVCTAVRQRSRVRFRVQISDNGILKFQLDRHTMSALPLLRCVECTMAGESTQDLLSAGPLLAEHSSCTRSPSSPATVQLSKQDTAHHEQTSRTVSTHRICVHPLWHVCHCVAHASCGRLPCSLHPRSSCNTFKSRRCCNTTVAAEETQPTGSDPSARPNKQISH